MHLDYRSSTTDCITLAILKLFWPKLHFQSQNQQAYFFSFSNLYRPEGFPNSSKVGS